MEVTLEKEKSTEQSLHKYENPSIRLLSANRFIITMCKQGACNGPGVSVREISEKE